MGWTTFLYLCLCLAAVSATFNQNEKYVIESYFVLDKEAFSNYEEEAAATALIDSIKDMNFFLTSANDRLATLKKFNVDIQFTVLKTERLNTDIFKPSGNGENNPNDILEAFNDWLETTQAKRRIGYDLAVLFTGHKLNYYSIGAQAGSICAYNSRKPQYPIAVVPFDGTSFCINALLKNIMFTIGAGKDGSGSYNIMRSSSMPVRSAEEYSFAECTAFDIKEFFTARDVNCLLESTSSTKGTVPNTHVDFYEGRALDPDLVCKRTVFKDSFACRYPQLYEVNELSGDAVCQKLYCTSEASHMICTPAWPTEGMWCDPGKLCKNGKCVDSMVGRINDVQPGCAFGDAKSFINKQGDTCASKLAEKGSPMCYDYGSKCCDTCRVYKTNYPDCKWGDKSLYVDKKPSSCAKYIQDRGISRCNGAILASICCKSCGDWKANQRGKRDVTDQDDIQVISTSTSRDLFEDEVSEEDIGHVMESTLTTVDEDGQLLTSQKIFKSRQIVENDEPVDIEV